MDYVNHWIPWRPVPDAEGTSRGVRRVALVTLAGITCMWPCPLAGMARRTRRLEEFVEHGQNGDADDQQRAEFDGQFLFHLLDVAFQFSFGDLKFGPDCLKVGLDFVNVMFQFGPKFLKFVVKGELEVFFDDQAFIKVGLPIGEDFGLVLGHAGPSQALDEGVGVEGDGLRLHGSQNSGWGGGAQAGVALSS